MSQGLVEAPPTRRRLWMRSLTSRLVAGVVALVIVVVAAIGSATYFFLRSYLYNRLDQQLAPIASANVQLLGRCVAFRTDCNIRPQSTFRAASTEWIMVLDADATPVVTVTPSDSLQPMNLSRDQRRDIVANPPAMSTLSTTNGTELRVSAQAVDLPDGHFVILSGLSTEEVTKILGRLVILEAFIGGAAVLLAFALTSWGVRRGLRNLYRVTATAQEVAAELSPTGTGLDRRVPVVEEGTEVGQLAESMNTLLAAVEAQFGARLESEQRLRQFLADASHELRTPLTSIRGFAELARMQRAAGETETTDNLGRIESEGTRMSRLVDDLLLLARGDADGTLAVEHRELVDVVGLLQEVVDGARAAFPQRQVDLRLQPVPPVLGDRDQLLRAIRNLITNAAVHTDPSRPIVVTAWTDAGGVVITVVDGGPGLPQEQAAHVFERFWRADKARSRARGGSGLGMSIVATIVRGHGGSVRFDSSVERGSTATVWLPAAAG